jgi:hypothetical protein
MVYRGEGRSRLIVLGRRTHAARVREHPSRVCGYPQCCHSEIMVRMSCSWVNRPGARLSERQALVKLITYARMRSDSQMVSSPARSVARPGRTGSVPRLGVQCPVSSSSAPSVMATRRSGNRRRRGTRRVHAATRPEVHPDRSPRHRDQAPHRDQAHRDQGRPADRGQPLRPASHHDLTLSATENFPCGTGEPAGSKTASFAPLRCRLALLCQAPCPVAIYR